jgi:GTP-binding protein
MATQAEADKLFSRQSEFIAGVAQLEQLPPAGLPEIGMVGRSNVGKSSIINALTARKTLAKVSVTPGRTRQLNFFNIDNRLILVDMPGYGYAKAPKTEIKTWTKLIKKYLAGRQILQRVCLLVDARHGIKDEDLEFMKLLDDTAVSYQIVLTKADKIKPAEKLAVEEATRLRIKKHAAAHPEVITTSSVTREGMDALRLSLAAFV